MRSCLSVPGLNLHSTIVDRCFLERTTDRITEFLKWPDTMLPLISNPLRQPTIRISSFPFVPPYTALSPLTATVNTWHSHKICTYTNLNRTDFVVLNCMIALTMMRVLRESSVLHVHDAVCVADHECLFSRPAPVEQYALLFENLRICWSCVQFFHSIGADREFLALREFLANVRSRLEV